MLGITFTLLYTTCIASPQLVLTTDKTEAELGHPIRVHLYGIDLKTSLSGINLDKLRPEFGIVSDYAGDTTTDQRWPGKSVQTLQLKLYPRKPGNIAIPTLSIGNIHSQKKILHILDGETGNPVLQFETMAPYQRQEMIIYFTLTTGYSNALLTTKPATTPEGIEIVPLVFERTKITDNKYQLQIGWAVTALTTGKQDIQLPAVEYSISGGSRRLFYPPVRSINVKNLPLYLPPTIPVGKISITSKITPSGLLRTNNLSYLTLQIKAKTSDVYTLPPVLRQVKSKPGLQVFPATSTRKNLVSHNEVTSEVTHTIPFKSLKSGLLAFPAIKFQYFDPEQGKIKSINYSTKPVFALSLFWKMFITILSIVISVWILKVVYNKWQQWQTMNSKRRQALQLLQEPGDKNNIRQAIRLFCEADTGSKNTTLTQWKQNWQKQYQAGEYFEYIYKAVSITCYGNQANIELTRLASELTRLFSNRKRLRKFHFFY